MSEETTEKVEKKAKAPKVEAQLITKREKDAQQKLKMVKVTCKYKKKGVWLEHQIEVAEDVAKVYKRKMEEGNTVFVKVG